MKNSKRFLDIGATPLTSLSYFECFLLDEGLVYICVRESVCVRERVRERENACVHERLREERMGVCVCVEECEYGLDIARIVV